MGDRKVLSEQGEPPSLLKSKSIRRVLNNEFCFFLFGAAVWI